MLCWFGNQGKNNFQSITYIYYEEPVSLANCPSKATITVNIKSNTKIIFGTSIAL